MLGFGGMGAVYKVKDRDLGQVRALKVMLPALIGSKKALDRFHSEIAISQQLGHEGIVRVHDLMPAEPGGTRFVTMEFVEGKTLHRHLNESGGKLPIADTLDIILQLCDALQYAHQHTIHRDLKPQNIMI